MATNKFTYRRMTPEQLRSALKEFGMPDGYKFARLYGADARRVRRWISGEEDPPHSVTLVLGLMTLPGGLQLAERIFQEMNVSVDDEAKHGQ